MDTRVSRQSNLVDSSTGLPDVPVDSLRTREGSEIGDWILAAELLAYVSFRDGRTASSWGKMIASVILSNIPYREDSRFHPKGDVPCRG